MDENRLKLKKYSKDVESMDEDDSFDPFLERKVDNPTTDCDTLIHLSKASLGTGILSMPLAFASAGLFGGVIGTILVSLVCTHCAYIIVKCAHVLYYRTRSSQMSFADVAETAFSTGPKWARPFAIPTRYLIQISLFVTYYGACSVYVLIVGKNFKQIIDTYGLFDDISERQVMLLMLVPLILLCWIPNLKYLAPVSMIANIFMASGLGITIYYLVKDFKPIDSSRTPYVGNLTDIPNFVSFTVFALEAIGVIMPLENSMKTPQNFVGICGVLNKGMSGVTFIYILVGFLGYASYGKETEASITLNLPSDEPAAQAVKILIALAVYCTFGLQFYVCLDIIWTRIKHRFQRNPVVANYTLRTVLVIGAVLLAVAVPEIDPFIGLIGAFSLSIVGLLIPVFIETVTYWNEGFGLFNWRAVKNIVICAVSLLALVFGSRSAINNIINFYSIKKTKIK